MSVSWGGGQDKQLCTFFHDVEEKTKVIGEHVSIGVIVVWIENEVTFLVFVVPTSYATKKPHKKHLLTFFETTLWYGQFKIVVLKRNVLHTTLRF